MIIYLFLVLIRFEYNNMGACCSSNKKKANRNNNNNTDINDIHDSNNILDNNIRNSKNYDYNDNDMKVTHICSTPNTKSVMKTTKVKFLGSNDYNNCVHNDPKYIYNNYNKYKTQEELIVDTDIQQWNDFILNKNNYRSNNISEEYAKIYRNTRNNSFSYIPINNKESSKDSYKINRSRSYNSNNIDYNNKIKLLFLDCFDSCVDISKNTKTLDLNAEINSRSSRTAVFQVEKLGSCFNLFTTGNDSNSRLIDFNQDIEKSKLLSNNNMSNIKSNIECFKDKDNLDYNDNSKYEDYNVGNDIRNCSNVNLNYSNCSSLKENRKDNTSSSNKNNDNSQEKVIIDKLNFSKNINNNTSTNNSNYYNVLSSDEIVNINDVKSTKRKKRVSKSSINNTKSKESKDNSNNININDINNVNIIDNSNNISMEEPVSNIINSHHIETLVTNRTNNTNLKAYSDINNNIYAGNILSTIYINNNSKTSINNDNLIKLNSLYYSNTLANSSINNNGNLNSSAKKTINNNFEYNNIKEQELITNKHSSNLNNNSININNNRIKTFAFPDTIRSLEFSSNYDNFENSNDEYNINRVNSIMINRRDDRVKSRLSKVSNLSSISRRLKNRNSNMGSLIIHYKKKTSNSNNLKEGLMFNRTIKENENNNNSNSNSNNNSHIDFNDYDDKENSLYYERDEDDNNKDYLDNKDSLNERKEEKENDVNNKINEIYLDKYHINNHAGKNIKEK